MEVEKEIEDEIKIVIHSCESPISEEPSTPTTDRSKSKFQPTNAYGCDECVWGIQDMQQNVPIYCTCEHGRRHTQPQPWIARLGERLVNFVRALKN